MADRGEERGRGGREWERERERERERAVAMSLGISPVPQLEAFSVWVLLSSVDTHTNTHMHPAAKNNAYIDGQIDIDRSFQQLILNLYDHPEASEPAAAKKPNTSLTLSLLFPKDNNNFPPYTTSRSSPTSPDTPRHSPQQSITTCSHL